MGLIVDLNADLGEGCAFDAELMSVVTSCNIACGGHAGNDETMARALQLAKANKVSAGAHPSFPDKETFGRTRSQLSGAALEQALTKQVGRLKTIADKTDVLLTHLKPHGALYNMAAENPNLARSVINVLFKTLPSAALFGPPQSELERQAKSKGVVFVAEGFADRAYEADGRLRSREKPGAMLHQPEDQTHQTLQIVKRRTVTPYQGKDIKLQVQTICVHGDTPEAFEAAKRIKMALEMSGISICPPA